MPGWVGGGANNGEDAESTDANNNPGHDTGQAEEQATEESTEDRGIPDPSEPSG